MNFATVIKKLRIDSGMTQEDLAGKLCISPQAISRWETDSAMPDISLIPVLCNLFSVSADYLLCINIEKRRQQIKEIVESALKCSSKGQREDAERILEEGLKDFPGEHEIMYFLMYIYHDYSHENKDGKAEEYRARALNYSKEILEHSNDNELRGGALQIGIFLNHADGNQEEAERLVESLHTLSLAKELVMPRILTGDKKMLAHQHARKDLLGFLLHNLECNFQTDSGEYFYTRKEWAEMRDKAVAILDILFEKGDFGSYHSHLRKIHSMQALYYVKEGDVEKTLCHIKKAAYHARSFLDFFEGQDHTYSSLAFRNFEDYEYYLSEDPANIAVQFKSWLELEYFDALRDSCEFREVYGSICALAQKWPG